MGLRAKLIDWMGNSQRPVAGTTRPDGQNWPLRCQKVQKRTELTFENMPWHEHIMPHARLPPPTTHP